MHIRRIAVILLVAVCAVCAHAAPVLKLVPYPKSVNTRDERPFAVTRATRIIIAGPQYRTAAETLAEEIERVTGAKPKIASAHSASSRAIYLTRTSDAAAKSLAKDVTLGDEGYVLRVTPSRVIVAGATEAGTFYGAQTLRQLITPAGTKHGAIPALDIRDWPSMRWRGIHDDISRGPIPTMDYMKREIRTAAEFKMNLFALYMEHVFAYRSVPVAAPGDAAITPEQVKELVAYGKKYYVTLLPEQQAFGHLHHVLKYEMYSDLAETPHGHVLAPVQPRTYQLISDMYAELVPLFPGPLLHIGADETWELGHGQTEALAQKEGIGRVYLEHLKKVTEILRPYHKRLMFWGDIALKYPELLNILPKDVIAVAWKYSPAATFDDQLKPYRDAGLDVFVSPGANNWNLIYPDLNAAFINIRNFVRDGQKYNALGMLNTTWDDDGEALFGMTWPAVVFGAAASWQQGESNIEQFTAAYDWAFYRNTDSTFRDAIMHLNHANALLKSVKMGGAYDDQFWIDPFTRPGADYIKKVAPVAHDLRIDAEQAIAALTTQRDKANTHGDTLQPMLMAAWRLDLLGMKVQLAAEANQYYWDAFQNQGDRQRVNRDLHEITGINARLQDLRDQTTRVRDLYADAWKAENRPYWLDNVLVRYDVLAQSYQKRIEDVEDARDAYRAGKDLATPDTLGFDLVPMSPAPTPPAPQPSTTQPPPPGTK